MESRMMGNYHVRFGKRVVKASHMEGSIILIHLTIIPKIAIFIFLLELYTQIGVIGGIKSKILSSSGYITTIESLSSLISL
jgi:hypothetical protein